MSLKRDFFKWLASEKWMTKAELDAQKKIYGKAHAELGIFTIDDPDTVERLDREGQLDLYFEFLGGVKKPSSIAAEPEVEQPVAQEEGGAPEELFESLPEPIEFAADVDELSDAPEEAEAYDEVAKQEDIEAPEGEAFPQAPPDSAIERADLVFAGLNAGKDDALERASCIPSDDSEEEELHGVLVFDIASGQVCELDSGRIVGMPVFVRYPVDKKGEGGSPLLPRDAKSLSYLHYAKPEQTVHLYATPCDLAGGNENIISRAIQRVLDRWKECNRDGFADGKSKHICLIPDTLADFSDPVKRQLRQFKGEVVPIPRSIAAIYTYSRKLNVSGRCHVYDLDLPKPCDVEIEVSDGDDGFSVVRRQRKPISKLNGCATRELMRCYLDKYGQEKGRAFDDDVKDALLSTREALMPMNGCGNIPMLESQGRLCALGYSDAAMRACREKFRAATDVQCGNGVILTAVDGIADENRIMSLRDLAFGCTEIERRIREGMCIWEEYLPALSLEVIRGGRFDKLELVDGRKTKELTEKTMNDRILLDIADKEKGKFTIPKGVSVIDLPLTREEFGNTVRDKLARFAGKELPLSEDTEVSLKLSYTFGEPDSYCLTAVGEDDPSLVLYSKWVDESEIEKEKKDMIDWSKFNKSEEFARAFVKPEMLHRYFESIKRRVRDVKNRRFVVEARNDRGYQRSNIFETLSGGKIFSMNTIKQATETLNYDRMPDIRSIVDDFWWSDEFLDLVEYIISPETSRLRQCASVKLVKVDIMNFVSQMGNFFNVDPAADDLLEKFEEETASNAEYAVSASRCISDRDDYMARLAGYIRKALQKNPQRTLRNISSVCWYNKEWMENLAAADPGVLKELEHAVIGYMTPSNAKKLSDAEKDLREKPRKVRDVMEAALALCSLRQDRPDIFAPGTPDTKEMIETVKRIDEELLFDYETSSKFVSRVEFDNADKGRLYKMNDTCFLLLTALSGSEKVTLLGFDEKK